MDKIFELFRYGIIEMYYDIHDAVPAARITNWFCFDYGFSFVFVGFVKFLPRIYVFNRYENNLIKIFNVYAWTRKIIRLVV